MVPKGILEGQIFYPILTQIIDSSSCSLLNTTYLYFIKRLPEIPEYAEMCQWWIQMFRGFARTSF